MTVKFQLKPVFDTQPSLSQSCISNHLSYVQTYLKLPEFKPWEGFVYKFLQLSALTHWVKYPSGCYSDASFSSRCTQNSLQIFRSLFLPYTWKIIMLITIIKYSTFCKMLAKINWGLHGTILKKEQIHVPMQLKKKNEQRSV